MRLKQADKNEAPRAADVVLKEKRRLVLLVREAPFHLGHLELMSRAAQYGAGECSLLGWRFVCHASR